MKVILKQDMDNLGERGKVVDVKAGYARNYLIPQGLAYEASEGNLRRVEEERKAAEERSKRDYLEEEEFWAQTERAKEHAIRFVERIRSGDVQHDPKGGFPCPTWCDLWAMCRVTRT